MKISDLTQQQIIGLKNYLKELEEFKANREQTKKEKLSKSIDDFETFVKLLFPHSVAQRPFEQSQHTKVLIKIIQYLVEQKLKNKKVVISIPPGHTKTLICNVLSSAWILGKFPNIRMLLGQCSQTEANKRNLELREIMSCDLFKQIFPDSYLTGTDVKWLKTNRQGGRLAVTTDPAMRFTGSDADLLIMDDANDTTSTQLNLEKVIDWYEKKAKRRLRRGNMGFVCIQQRVDTNDLTGHILSKQSDVLHILLRAEAEEDYTISIPLVDGTYDNILIKKGYLWDDPEMIKIYKEAKTNINTWETQYQQSPSISSGKFFDKIDIEAVQIPISEINNKKNCHYMISVDTAGGNNEQTGTGDFTAIAILKYSKEENILYMENIFQLDLKFTDLANRLMMIAENIKTTGSNFSILIEENHIGAALQNHLETVHKISNIRTIKRTSSMRKGNMSESLKEDMARSMVLKIFAKKIFFPRDGEIHNMTTFKNEMLQFPKGKHDDMIDAVSNCIYYLAEKFRY